MRAVVQRVREASVTVDAEVVGAIGAGLLVLLGVDENDSHADADYIVDKTIALRIFNDDDGKFNRSLEDAGGAVLVVSQFTLHGDCRKGRRPSFIRAARPEKAIPLYEYALSCFRERGIETAAGVFGAHMDVRLLNDGPVTLLLDSGKAF
ncbi:MAG: D-tyrosyl-tRNA(Tyr) deacylase [Candidatus Hydrogenedens sp.]|nr:D-tyrosyl-tRNA(Tyr) deacylase [Candidatus Hydrogenedens sp.]